MSLKVLEWFGAPLTVTAAGVLLFSINLHSDDAGILAGLIFICAGAVAFLFRKPGFMFGSLLGLSIIVSEIWNRRFGVPRPQMTSTRDFILLTMFVTAISVAGSSAGFGLRRLAQSSIRIP